MPTTSQNNTKKRKLYKSRYNNRKDKRGGTKTRTTRTKRENPVLPKLSLSALSVSSKKSMKPERKSKSSKSSMIIPDSKSQAMKIITNKKNEYEQKFSHIGMNVIRNYLKNICPDSGHCLAFGRENVHIDKFFDFFNDFTYVDTASIKKINSGANGFITMMDFTRDGYTVSTIMKAATEATSDSLFYEAFVGLTYINEQNNYFPCFLKTYNLFKINKKDYRKRIEDPDTYRSELAPDLLNAGLKKLGINDAEAINTSCSSPTQITLLLQFIENPVQLHDWIYKEMNNPMFCVEIVSILFQVYSVLAAISDEFTHYDLHTGNVLIYQVPDSKYVTMQYHTKTGPVVVFKTRYIAKIIDYGRCYTKQTEELYTNVICKTSGCKDTVPCGNDEGFNFFDDVHNKDNFFISSRKRNKSHDLRLATLVYLCFLGIHRKNSANQIFSNKTLLLLIDYMKEIYHKYDPTNIYSGNKYGNPEDLGDGIEGNTVNDFATYLYFLMTNKGKKNSGINQFEQDQHNFYTKEKVASAGTFEVWLARNNPMKFKL